MSDGMDALDWLQRYEGLGLVRVRACIGQDEDEDSGMKTFNVHFHL